MFGIDDAILGTVGAGLVNNLFAGSRQDDAQSFSAQQYATRYQTTVKDMEAAGLNPMLAYGGISGSSPTSSAASAGGMGDVGATVNQSRMTSAQVANIAADTENKKAQADLIEAQAAQAWSTAGQAQANTGLINANANKAIAELENIPKEGKRLDRLANMLYEQANLMSQQQLTESQKYEVLKATVSKIKSETGLLDLDIEAAKSLDNLGRTSKELKPIVDMLRVFMRK